MISRFSKITAFLILWPLTSQLAAEPSDEPLAMESLAGEGVWISSRDNLKRQPDSDLRATVWFEKQWLGDGKAYDRRAREFSKMGRQELRKKVIQALKKQSEESYKKASTQLRKLEEEQVIRNVDQHWIVNGFTCSIQEEDLPRLEKVSGVRKVFFQPAGKSSSKESSEVEKWPVVEAPSKPSFEGIPWYVEKLKVDQVWKEFGFAGQGSLNVIHDKNFVVSDHLTRTIYRAEKEIPNNGLDDDGNGYVDDAHGYNFDHQSAQIFTRPFTGGLKQKSLLHGTNCATIASGAASLEGVPQFGLAPLSRWAGVINQGGIERSVEWAIEHDADTYSMSFSRRNFGEYQSHWRKVMEHGSFCGVYFVSGAGNREKGDPHPFLMNIPQNIPNAVFAAAGVQRDLSKTQFSCVGPVEWQTEHYQDGIVQKPEVCAFNQAVPVLLPDGKTIPKFLNGNSYAGPMFCGTISILLSADPDLLPWDLQDIITSTATDVGPTGVDYETGYGLINCYAAVKEVLRRKKER